jgi:hypothetical protein
MHGQLGSEYDRLLHGGIIPNSLLVIFRVLGKSDELTMKTCGCVVVLGT